MYDAPNLKDLRLDNVGPFPYIVQNENQLVYQPNLDKNAIWHGIILEYLTKSSQIQVPFSQRNVAHAYGYAMADLDNSKKLSTVTDHLSDRVGTIHENFEARKAAGEIMVSNYTRYSVLVRHHPGLYGTDSAPSGWAYLNWDSLVEAGMCTYHKHGYQGKGSYYLFKNGYAYKQRREGGTCCRYLRMRSGSETWAYAQAPSAASFLDALKEYTFDSKELVTDVLANANRSSLDILTAAAEMPQFLESVYKGLKVIANLTLALKRKQVLQSNAYGSKRKAANARYNSDLARINEGLKSSKIHGKRRKALLKRRQELSQSYTERMKRFADEFSQASADVWLNYRYNIMPTVYVIQDALEAADRYKMEYITARGTRRESTKLDLPNDLIVLNHKVSCVIKRNFQPYQGVDTRAVISADLFTTAWELVPLSFVVDWFVNIGDILQSVTYNKSWDQEGATLARKSEIEQTRLTLSDADEQKDWLIQPYTTVEGYYYTRSVINPSSLCGLVFMPTVGLARQVDAAALLWRPVRSLFLKRK